MIQRDDIELIAMILQRAPVNPIEAQWLNAKLDEFRELVAIYCQQPANPAAEERAGSAE
jgi:hypothetical protein